MELTVREDTLIIYSTDIEIKEDCIDLTDYATVEEDTLVII